MKIFEFHFNPKSTDHVIMDSFCYEPENDNERKLGNLFMVGQLTNVFPQNSHFLDNLASIIKKEFYGKSQLTPEESLKQALKVANTFFSKEAQKGNVSWLGNLNFAVVNIKNFILNFAKTGNLKILLIREKEILDVSQNLEFQDTEPYLSKIFGNIAVGKLALRDRVLILTQDIFEFFQKENLLEELAQSTSQKQIKEVLKTKESTILKEISGICLLIEIEEKERFRSFASQEKIIPFWGGRFFYSPLMWIISLFAQIPLRSLFKFPLFKTFLIKISLLKHAKLTKHLFLILILIVVLIFGFFISELERKKEISKTKEILKAAESIFIQAENVLIFKDEKKANLLLQEAWKKILPLLRLDTPLNKEVKILKQAIEEKLFSLNKLENIKNPQLAPDQEIFKTQKDIFLTYGTYFYFLDKKTGEILKCSKPEINKNCQLWLNPETKKVFGAKSMAIDGSIWVLTRKNEIDRYYFGEHQETLKFNPFPPLKNPIKIWVSNSFPYLYILDPGENRILILTKKGEIVKQYQSKKFDNLLDFVVSQDGNIIYLLNGSKVYQIIFKF